MIVGPVNATEPVWVGPHQQQFHYTERNLKHILKGIYYGLAEQRLPFRDSD